MNKTKETEQVNKELTAKQAAQRVVDYLTAARERAKFAFPESMVKEFDQVIKVCRAFKNSKI